MKIPLMDLALQQRELRDEIEAGFAQVLSSTTLEQVCRRAAQAAVRRTHPEALTYQI